MALKDWWDVPYTAADCVRDHNQWNSIVEYVKHSACTDFTIHSTCTSGGQAFRFTQTLTFSQMYGGAGADEDMMISANDTDLRSRIMLYGAGNIHLDSGNDVIFKENGAAFLQFGENGTDDIIEGQTAGNDLKIAGVEGIHNYFKAGEEFKLFDGATEALKVTYAGNITVVEGGANVADNLRIKASSADGFPYIWLPGSSDIQMRTINYVNLYKGNTAYMRLGEIGTDDLIEGLTPGNDLYLKPVGVVKFGTYNAKGAEAFDGFIPIKDEAGNNRKLMTCA